MKIASASNGRCVARGFSIMRLALGYEEALPFPIDYSPASEEMPLLISKCFPQHHILLFCEKAVVEGMDIPSNVEYMGKNADGYSLDDYLWAFSYLAKKDGEKAHLVIGSPALGLWFHQIFAIELGGNELE